MKKVLFVSGFSSETYYLKELRKRFDGRVLSDKYSWQQICFQINPGKVEILKDGKLLDGYDLVWIRGATSETLPIVISLARVFSRNRVKVINSAWVENLVSTSKLIALTELAQNNFPIPECFACLVDQAFVCQDIITRCLGMPLIIKDSVGQKGKMVYLIDNKRQLSSFLKKYDSKKILIFQKYIKKGKDHRVLVMGGEPLVWEVRIKYQDEVPGKRFWDKEEIYQDVKRLPVKMKEIALQSAKLLKLEIAGVDILEDENRKYWLLEVNRTPGISSQGKYIEDINAAVRYLERELGMQ